MTRAVREPESVNPEGAYCDLNALLRLRHSARFLNLSSPRPARSQLAGAQRTVRRGRGMDFEEVRVYQPGDDIRSIDWRVTARTQVPHTKIYREERERPVILLTDQRAPMFFGSQQCFKSVVAAHLSALIAWATLEAGDRIGALVFGPNGQRDVRPRRSKHAVLEVLQQLQAYNHALTTPVAEPNDQNLESLLRDARRVARPGSAVFILSDFHDLDDAGKQQLFELARHTEVTLIHIYDPLEAAFSANGQLAISDGHEQLQLPAGDRDFQRAWQQQFAAQQTRLVDTAGELRLRLLSFSTTDDCLRLLRDAYGTRGKRRS
ncbi:DUF58 domain-containing protein [Marinimicrobium alkaliphilum]|uniref:DUF58 domain-containing protein n=1 Tax=Marinimicrobium alkaliphilum TaxID=2202654 RepID=UPI000DB9D1B9|nr:DUF58 domain-containing protein [Marinimicrobium alkaliphilum]